MVNELNNEDDINFITKLCNKNGYTYHHSPQYESHGIIRFKNITRAYTILLYFVRSKCKYCDEPYYVNRNVKSNSNGHIKCYNQHVKKLINKDKSNLPC